MNHDETNAFQNPSLYFGFQREGYSPENLQKAVSALDEVARARMNGGVMNLIERLRDFEYRMASQRGNKVATLTPEADEEMGESLLPHSPDTSDVYDEDTDKGQ